MSHAPRLREYKECKTCGTLFTKRLKESHKQFDSKTFCSRGCPWVGRKHSEETKLNLAKSHLGIPQPWKKGALSHFWKGGKTAEALRIRGSSEYRTWRRNVFERDNYTCVFCGKRGGRLNADHIKPFAHYPDLRLDLSNGRTLCEPCHMQTPTFAGNARRK